VNNLNIIKRNDTVIKEFIEKFSITKKPIEVSFRSLLPEITNIDRCTHLIHTYPAKLLVHIPYFFLNNSFFSKPGDVVLDPFGGSGTVLLESILAGRNALGADANPLARLIAEVKVSKLNADQLSAGLKKVIACANRCKPQYTPEIVNCNFWFPETVTIQLSKLLIAINKIEDIDAKKFFLVALSNCVKKVSYADPRISVPVKINANRFDKSSDAHRKIVARLKHLESVDVFAKFSIIANENIERFRSLGNVVGSKVSAKIVSDDARKLTSELGSKKLLRKNSVQLIISSPPYAGAQKYIRASSLSLGWTQLATVQDLSILDRKNIGRENYRKSDVGISKTNIKKADTLIAKVFKSNPVRATIIYRYLNEMKEALDEMIRVLKNGGFIVLIIGNNRVCGVEFNTQEYLTTYLTEKGLQLQFKLIDDIQSYGLMTKRNKTADIISREWILVFKKLNND
jgi:DNA modification methylase